MSKTKSTYIILLRAVNVSGKNMVKMADLKAALKALGFEDVQTYIQSGNVILQSSDSANSVKMQVETLLAETFGLSVDSFVLEPTVIAQAIDQIPLSGEMEPNRLFITMLDQKPESDLLSKLHAIDHADEQFQVRDNILYFYLPNGMAKAKMNNNYFERKLKVTATGRNLNTLRKLLELASAQ